MSLPLAHACLGGSLGVALWPEATPTGLRRGLWVGGLLALLPDLDIGLARIGALGVEWHHGFTHSIAFALIIGMIAARLTTGGWRARGVLACVLAALSHLLLDYLMTETRGIALFWPVTDHRYKFGHSALTYYRIASPWGGVLAIAQLLAFEAAVFIPLLAITLLVRWRAMRRLSPLSARS